MRYRKIFWASLVLCLCASIPLSPWVIAHETGTFVFETVPSRDVTPIGPWTTTRWLTESHPQPRQLTITVDGSFYGVTMSGHYFSQIRVPNEFAIPVYRFTMDEHTHLIIGGEVVYTLAELSIRLAALKVRDGHVG